MTDEAAWGASGMMTLTGPPEGPRFGPPERLVPTLHSLGQRIEAASAQVGRRVAWDWLALLGERAALDGLSARGTTSCGGATRLLAAPDGWIALSLARPDDHDLLPAWRELASDGRAQSLVEAGELLGLPVARLGERSASPDAGVGTEEYGSSAKPTRAVRPPRVLDLSSLWAGPLCASIMAAAGADVIKVESIRRPDASRAGSPDLFDRLNHAKRSVALDLGHPDGRVVLRELVASADVVVEASRPRALEQLGIVAAHELARPGGVTVWVSITGHGRASQRVSFGDDAAVAGGLVTAGEGTPWFCGDAIADPLSGVAAAAAALDALVCHERVLIDVSMAGVAAAHAGSTDATDAAGVGNGSVAPPRARPTPGPARPFGADTATVLATWTPR